MTLFYLLLKFYEAALWLVVGLACLFVAAIGVGVCAWIRTRYN